MKNCSRLLLLTLMFSAPTFAEVTKIVEIIDTNLYRTEAGALVSLANVQTVSIHSPDSAMSQFAKMTMTYLSQHLLYKKVKIEYVEIDTISLVDLKVIRNILHDVSLNFEMLKLGYGRLVEEPRRKRATSYRNAADYAQTHHLGFHKQGFFEPSLPAGKNAFWLQGSLGIGIFYVLSSFVEPTYSSDLSIHARWNKTLFTCGVTDEILQQPFALWGPYFAVGQAFSHSKMENGLYAGLRVFPFGEAPGEDVHIFPLVKIQAAKHGKNVGGGFSIEYSTNFEISFVKVSANLLIGKWNK